MGFKAVLALKLKALLGIIALRAFPERARRIENTIVEAPYGLLDRLIRSGLLRSVPEQDRLVDLHNRYWAGAEGTRFSESRGERFKDWFLTAHLSVVDELQKLIDSDTKKYAFFYEIGCGDGQVTHYMSKRLASVKHFTGLDINPDVVAANNRKYRHGTLDFVSANAIEWISRNAQPGSIFLSNGGVLEYFSESQICCLLQKITRDCKPAAFALIEPVADDYDLEKETASRPFGREWSFSHNHRKLLESNGFTIEYQRETRTGGVRWMLLLARTQDKDYR
jgi:SAM-dependent methyltransferase